MIVVFKVRLIYFLPFVKLIVVYSKVLGKLCFLNYWKVFIFTLSPLKQAIHLLERSIPIFNNLFISFSLPHLPDDNQPFYMQPNIYCSLIFFSLKLTTQYSPTLLVIQFNTPLWYQLTPSKLLQKYQLFSYAGWSHVLQRNNLPLLNHCVKASKIYSLLSYYKEINKN